MIAMMKNITEAAMTKKRSTYSQSRSGWIKGVDCEGVRVVEGVRV